MKKLNFLLLLLLGTVGMTFAQFGGGGSGGGGGMRMGGGGFPGMNQQQPQIPQEEIPRGSSKISGKLIDSTTNKAVEFASVAVYDKNNKVVDGAMTDMNGSFTVKNLAKGTYKVVGSFIGYKNTVVSKVEIKANKEEVNVGNLIMSTDTKVLGEVTVTGQGSLIEDKVDRLVYNADKDITSKGGTAEDVLRKVPMLTVDMDGNVQMRGSGNVKVLINNKPSSILASNVADAIKQIPADMIKQVEVITSPSAKYDAEGTTGIINIITKKNNLQGLTGFVNAGAGVRGANAFGNVNLRKKKIGTALNFGGNSSYNTPGDGSTDRTSSVGGFKTIFKQTDKNDVRRLFANSQLTIDYDINPKNSMSLSARYGVGDFNTSGSQSTLLTGVSGNILRQFEQETKNIRGNRSIDVDFNYTKTFKEKGHELALLAQHGRNIRVTDFVNIPNNAPLNKSRNDGINGETTFQLDYTYPFKKNIFEAGAKYILREVTSEFDFFQRTKSGIDSLVANRTNNFNYDQDVSSVYSTFTISLPKKWGIKAGVRYENTQITAKFQNSDKPIPIPAYENFIPSLSISKDFPKNHKVRASYTQRIQRPSLEFLNPFVNYSDPLNISKGNPDLKPELSHSFELNYSTYFKANSINVSVFRRFTDNNITSVRSVNELGITTSTFDNIGKTNFYGGSVFINLQPTKSLRVGGGTNITKNLLSGSITIPILDTKTNKYIITDLPISNEGWNASVNFNASYTFTKGWGAQAFGFMGSRQIQLQGYQGSFRYYNLGLKKDFKNKKGSFTLGLDNPFTKSLKISSESSDPTYKSVSVRNIYNRGARFSINYMFGKMDFSGGNMFRSKKKVSNDDAKAGEGDGAATQQPAAGGGRPR